MTAGGTPHAAGVPPAGGRRSAQRQQRSAPARRPTSASLSALARRMVGRWGMSDPVAPIDLVANEDRHVLAAASSRAELVLDKEITKLVQASHARATDLLSTNRARLDALATALLAAETLDEAEAYQAAGIPIERAG